MNDINDFIVNGNYSEWSQWSQCTVTCGGGSTSRSRKCDNPEPGNGGATCVQQDLGASAEAKACNTKGCPSECILCISNTVLSTFT